MKAFAKNLRELRLQRRLTQHNLAVLLNTTNSSVCDWECERAEPNYDTLKKIADILDISIDELFDRRDG